MRGRIENPHGFTAIAAAPTRCKIASWTTMNVFVAFMLGSRFFPFFVFVSVKFGLPLTHGLAKIVRLSNGRLSPIPELLLWGELKGVIPSSFHSGLRRKKVVKK